MKDFVAWYSAEARPPFNRAIVQQYRSVLESAGLAPASINLRLSAIRKLDQEAAENGLLDRSVAQGIVSLKASANPATGQGLAQFGNSARDLLAQLSTAIINATDDDFRQIVCDWVPHYLRLSEEIDGAGVFALWKLATIGHWARQFTQLRLFLTTICYGRSKWIGGVSYNPSVPSGPFIDVYLAQLAAGEKNPLSAQSRSSQTKRTVRIGVGLLPYMSIASVWQQRRPIRGDKQGIVHESLAKA